MKNYRDLGYYIFPISIVILATILLLVDKFLGVILAIKGSYVFIGVLITAILYFTEKIVEFNTPKWARGNERVVSKVFFILISLFVTTTILFGTRMRLILIFFPVLYGLLGFQIYSTPFSRFRLVEAASLFSVSLFTKFSEHYRLLGGGDMILHIRAVEQTMLSGSIEPIGRGYSKFPLLHILSSSTGIVTDLIAYNSLLIVGIFAGIFLILPIFAYIRTLSKFNIAIYAAISVTILDIYHYFSTYVFPQSLAVVFIIYIIYVSYRVNITRKRIPLVISGAIFSCALFLTHHFTVILFLPAALLLSVLPTVQNSIRNNTDGNILTEPNRTILLLPIIISVSYWVFLEVFIGGFYYAIKNKFSQDLLISSSSDTVGILEIGHVVSPQTTIDAILSLLSPVGIYYILIVVVFYLGILKVLESEKYYQYPLSEVLLGIFGSLFILKVPVITNTRLSHIFALFFVVCVSFGLKWIVESTENNGALLITSIVIIGTLGTTAPFAANPDLADRDSIPDFYESLNKPPYEGSLTQSEYETLAAASSFSNKFSIPVTTDGTSGRILHRFGGILSVPIDKWAQRSMATYEGGKVYLESDVVLYRSGWVDHTIHFAGTRFVISRQMKKTTVASNNKIYTAGQTGMLWTNGVISFDSNISRSHRQSRDLVQ